MSLNPKPYTLTPRLYGRRKGRALADAQQDILDECLARWGIDRAAIEQAKDNSLDPADFFKPSTANRQPLPEYWLEIGFGQGEHILAQAQRNPQIGLIGAEPFVNGLAKVASTIKENAISNIRIFPHDVRHLLPKLQDGCLARVFLFFPDPWPKKRHEKRRFISQENLQTLARVIKRGGAFFFASDDPTYQRWATEQMAAQDFFRCKTLPGPFTESEPDFWVETRYQKKANRAGRISLYSHWEKC